MAILELCKKPMPSTELLDFLDHFRKQVQEGMIDGIAIAYTTSDGYTGSGWQAPRVTTMVGAIEMMKQELLNY